MDPLQFRATVTFVSKNEVCGLIHMLIKFAQTTFADTSFVYWATQSQTHMLMVITIVVG